MEPDLDATKVESYPVWVGSLAGNVNEAVLNTYFKKFGPMRSVIVMRDKETQKSKQFGYINYYNREVAEVAAKEMNGREICGKKIKTKGPKTLTPYSPPQTPCPTMKKDFRPLIDCNFYIKDGECTPKEGQVITWI